MVTLCDRAAGHMKHWLPGESIRFRAPIRISRAWPSSCIKLSGACGSNHRDERPPIFHSASSGGHCWGDGRPREGDTRSAVGKDLAHLRDRSRTCSHDRMDCCAGVVSAARCPNDPLSGPARKRMDAGGGCVHQRAATNEDSTKGRDEHLPRWEPTAGPCANSSAFEALPALGTGIQRLSSILRDSALSSCLCACSYCCFHAA
jgi:hypothetical protein